MTARGVHHVAHRCLDLAACARFWEGVLGLRRVREQPGRSIWLALGDGVLMLERREPGEPPVPAGSLDLLALAVSPAERGAVLDRLASAGVAVEAETEHTSYFRDPDGRRVAVSTYPLP